MTLLLADFTSRLRLPLLLNDRHLLGQAVGIGTHQGHYARILLDAWRGQTLYCVDPYLRNYDPTDPASAGDRAGDLAAARLRLFKHAGRFKILQQTSEEAAASFAPESLVFVYIDG